VSRRAPTAGGTPHEAGQGLVEFAFVAPLLVFLIMAIFQFAFVFQSQIGLTNAVREAGRRASTATAADEGTMRSFVVDQLTGSGFNPGLLAQNVQGYASSRLAAGSPDVTFCTYDVAGTTNERIQITVTYGHPVFFPLLAFATDFLDHTPDGDWTLSTTSQMRLENDLGTAPGTTC
jgi:Flp pilus assembly protein TadG